MQSFRVYDSFEERVPVYEFELLGESNWVERSYNSAKDFEKGILRRERYPSEAEVLKSLQYFESHWHNYNIVEF
jgi:hypothetical protein